MGQHEEDGNQICEACGAAWDAHEALSPDCPGEVPKTAVPVTSFTLYGRPSEDFDSVGVFHKKFDLPSVTHAGTYPHLIPHDVALFRMKFLREELEEFTEGVLLDDLPKIADALVDLVYVALGTAHYYGLPWAELFEAVQRANMEKVRANADGSNSTRGSSFDVVKPPGWQKPDIGRVLREFGWELGRRA